MDRFLAVWSSRVAGTVVVLWTLSSAWWTLLWVAAVVAGVVALCRHVEKCHQGTLPPGGRVVLITGCDSGIGREVAIAASQRGMTVVAGCLDVHGAENLAVMDRVHVLHLDVTDDVSIAEALGQVTSICGEQGLWGLVNNAGLNRQAPVELTSMMTFQRLADVMLFGTVRVTKAFLPLVRRAKGRVVNMSSDRGIMSPANSAAYCITKHGVETFSDVLRAEMTSLDFDVTVSIMEVGHFGGATAIIDDRNMDAMKTNMEQDLAQCSPEVQEAYGGQRAVQNILDATRASQDSSPSDVTPVVSAILHSLLSTDPDERYQVHGGKGLVDWGLVLGQLKPILPLTVFKLAQKLLWR